jgi:hypothetical protein
MHASIRVTTARNNHGYPWTAVCPCGWQSRGYVSRHAAELMSADHQLTEGN